MEEPWLSLEPCRECAALLFRRFDPGKHAPEASVAECGGEGSISVSGTVPTTGPEGLVISGCSSASTGIPGPSSGFSGLVSGDCSPCAEDFGVRKGKKLGECDKNTMPPENFLRQHGVKGNNSTIRGCAGGHAEPPPGASQRRNPRIALRFPSARWDQHRGRVLPGGRPWTTPRHSRPMRGPWHPGILSQFLAVLLVALSRGGPKYRGPATRHPGKKSETISRDRKHNAFMCLSDVLRDMHR